MLIKFAVTKIVTIFAHTNNKIVNKMVVTKSLRSRVSELEVGEQIVVPVSEYGYTTIRSYASDLGFALCRKFSSARNREERTYTITRVQ